MTLLSELGLGLLLGWLGGLFGIGGGLMAIPALVALFAMDQALAQGTALVMIAPNVLLGFWRYRQHNPIDIRSACLLGSCSIVSTYALARWAANLDMHTMRLMFAAFLIALSAYMAWGLRPRASVAEPRIALSKAWFPLLGLLSGVFSGLFTVGGGLVVAPALMKWFGDGHARCGGGAGHLRAGRQGGLVGRHSFGPGRHAEHEPGRGPGPPLTGEAVAFAVLRADGHHRLGDAPQALITCLRQKSRCAWRWLC